MVEIVYLGSYNVFTHNKLIFTRLGNWEWMDGEGCCWMTTSKLGRYLQIERRFLLGSLGSVFLGKQVYYSKYNVFTGNLLCCTSLGTWDWVDGSWTWMTSPHIPSEITHRLY